MSETFGRSLRRHRRAAGLSQQDLAQRTCLSQSDVSRYERDRQRPGPSTMDVLDELLDTGGELRALDSSAGRKPDPAARRGAGGACLDDEITALELARRVTACDVGVTTLGHLEAAFDDLATAYPASSPHDLLPRLRQHLAYVATLLESPRKNLAAHRRLITLGGWFCLLAATVRIDLNEHAPALAHLRTAESLANEAEHPDIRAWCYETEAWRTLAGGNARRAAELSQHAQRLAPAGSSAAIQATAQEGRAHARTGSSGATYRALANVHDLADGLRREHSLEHHYQYDTGKAAAYTATTLAWLGDPEAGQHARAVIERFRPTRDGQPWPRRYATAHVDLALCAAKAGEPEEAVDAARTAMASGSIAPSNWWRVGEVVREVTAKRVTGAAELQERYRAMTDP